MYDNHHHHHDSFDQGNGAIGSFKFLDDHVPHLSIRPYHACGDYHCYDDDVADKSSFHNLSSFSFQVGLHGWILPPGLILLCDMFVYRLDFSLLFKIFLSSSWKYFLVLKKFLVWSYSAICLSTGCFLMYEKLRYFKKAFRFFWSPCCTVLFLARMKLFVASLSKYLFL